MIAKNDVSIHTSEHTQITGAVIASTDGNVAIDTGTLGYADLQDEDKHRASTVQVSASSSSETSGPSAGAPSKDSSPVAAGGTIEGAYSSSKTEGVTRATVASPNGTTTITIRSNPSQGLEGLNSDLAKAQEITKTKKVNVEVYVNSDTIKEIVGGFPTAEKIRDAVIEQIRKISPAEADSLEARDRIIDKLIKQQSMKSGVPEEELRDILDSDPGLIKKIENGDAFAKLYGSTEDKDVIEAAAKAIIQGGYILTDGQGTPLLDERGYARIGGVLVEALPDIPGSAVVRLPGESTGSFVKQAGEYAESAVLSLSRLVDQYGAAGEAIYTATSLAVLGPAKTALNLVADRVVSEITGEMTAEAMDFAAQKLKGLDASLTDGEAFALVTVAGLGIALAASYKDVKNLLAVAKAKLGIPKAPTGSLPHETPTPGTANAGPRFVTDAAGNTIDLNFTQGLSKTEVPVTGARGGVKYPLEGQAPNSYADIGNGHAVVYGPNGRALYDVSASRIKVIEWNQDPNGEWFAKKSSQTKVFRDNVPSSILKDLGLK